MERELTAWIAGVAAAVDEVACSIGVSAVEVLAETPAHWRSEGGVRICLRGCDGVAELRFVATCAAHSKVAAVMLQFPEDDPALTTDLIEDAIGEIANMVAGSAKSRLLDSSVTLTIPEPVAHAMPDAPSAWGAFAIRLDDVVYTVIVSLHNLANTEPLLCAS